MIIFLMPLSVRHSCRLSCHHFCRHHDAADSSAPATGDTRWLARKNGIKTTSPKGGAATIRDVGSIDDNPRPTEAKADDPVKCPVSCLYRTERANAHAMQCLPRDINRRYLARAYSLYLGKHI